MLYEKELADKIIGMALEVHRTLGPGCWLLTWRTNYVRAVPFEKEAVIDRYKDVRYCEQARFPSRWQSHCRLAVGVAPIHGQTTCA
jgi:hypothetical protein